jgi:hypothetical protein
MGCEGSKAQAWDIRGWHGATQLKFLMCSCRTWAVLWWNGCTGPRRAWCQPSRASEHRRTEFNRVGRSAGEACRRRTRTGPSWPVRGAEDRVDIPPGAEQPDFREPSAASPLVGHGRAPAALTVASKRPTLGYVPDQVRRRSLRSSLDGWSGLDLPRVMWSVVCLGEWSCHRCWTATLVGAVCRRCCGCGRHGDIW